MKRKALTRNQVIKIWQKQPEDLKNSFCCPNCRDILINVTGRLQCDNEDCDNTHEYKTETGVEL